MAPEIILNLDKFEQCGIDDFRVDTETYIIKNRYMSYGICLYELMLTFSFSNLSDISGLKYVYK
jgi:hypothetical protein